VTVFCRLKAQNLIGKYINNLSQVQGLSDFIAIPSPALWPPFSRLKKAVNNSHVPAAFDLHLRTHAESRHKKNALRRVPSQKEKKKKIKVR